MKTRVTLVLLAFMAQMAVAQSHKKITQLSSTDVVKVLNEVEMLGESQNNALAVKVYKIDNGMKNLNITGGKVAYSIFVAVANKEEEAEQRLFDIRAFYNPRFVAWKEVTDDAKTFVLAYTENNQEKQVTLKATLEGITELP